MNIAYTITELNNATKQAFKGEVSAMVARCPAFGHDDCCVVFVGSAKVRKAANLFIFASKLQGAVVEAGQSEFMGKVSYSASVTWKGE